MKVVVCVCMSTFPTVPWPPAGLGQPGVTAGWPEHCGSGLWTLALLSQTWTGSPLDGWKHSGSHHSPGWAQRQTRVSVTGVINNSTLSQGWSELQNTNPPQTLNTVCCIKGQHWNSTSPLLIWNTQIWILRIILRVIIQCILSYYILKDLKETYTFQERFDLHEDIDHS